MKRNSALRLRQPGLGGIALVLIAATAVQAEPVKLAEPFSNQRPYSTQTSISTRGKVYTVKTGGGREELDMSADVEFDFLGRRLPPAGREASAFREARQFIQARLNTTVAGHTTSIELAPDRRLIVAHGDREGIFSYSPQGPLTRETVDLLEIPGDPLALLALLPPTDVRTAEEWSPADWVLQMLTGVEAVESSDVKCRLDQATEAFAKVTFNGKITGQRLGTNISVNVVGVFLFNLETQYLSQAKTIYTIKSDVGTINPGLDMSVTTTLTRNPTGSPGGLTDEFLSGIPLDPPPNALSLQYTAAPWGLDLRHSRDWHLFQAVYDGGAPVAILRLMDEGSLISQCNLSPAPTVPAGQTTPLEQFEADIQQSLGERFGEVLSREKIPAPDGRQIYRVAVQGNVVIKSVKGRADIPMNWIYYLVANPQGRQASLVFSVEPALLEQLRGRDRELVMNLNFVTPQR